MGARAGFEAAFFAEISIGHRLTGNTTAHESTALWSVGYDVTVDHSWRTVAAQASNLTAAGVRELTLTRGTGEGGAQTASRDPSSAGASTSISSRPLLRTRFLP